MYSKSLRIATWPLWLLVAACSHILPWSNEPVENKASFVFNLEKNVIVLPSTEINGRPARSILDTSARHSAVDSQWAAMNPASQYRLVLSRKSSLPFQPVTMDLRGVADTLLGDDVWGGAGLTIDYQKGVAIYQKEGIHPEGMSLFRFQDRPAITVQVDGNPVQAIVDTSNPDTLVLPRKRGRERAAVKVAGTDFGVIDVGRSDEGDARIGNRLLSRFLVTIDFGRHEVGLWRDPRIPLR